MNARALGRSPIAIHLRNLFVFTLVLTCWWQGAYAAGKLELRTVSSRPDAVSGGSALVALEAPGDQQWKVYLNAREISASFRRSEGSGKLLALVTGLKPGNNTIEVRVEDKTLTKLQILNHPLSGPIFSGPHQQPFICQTQANGLGPSVDAHCTANTLVQYYYKSTEPSSASSRDLLARYDAIFNATPDALAPGFKPYDLAAQRPSDIAQTVLADGRAVDYIVRREVGVINRAAYEIRFLHQPGQPLPTPWTAPTVGWNGRLIYTFGGGCGPGYRQGVLPTFMQEYAAVLAQGYALVTSSLNVLGNNCNDKVSAETASMVKEHFIERYGEPAYTIGMGGSGGAMSVHLIAQNYPGILDGIIGFGGAPDLLTSAMQVFNDCALIEHALKQSKLSWTEVQRTGISGLATWQACVKTPWWLDPKACDPSLPKQMIYDRAANPNGARCTFFDNAVNVFGRDPKTGFARRAIDNVGIQYGLMAFNAGKIDAEQFIELNQLIGGYDQDGQIVATRTVADPEALRLAYERGVVVTGKTLSELPIVDWIGYADDLGDLHTRDRAFMTRSRLLALGADAENQAILVTPRPIYEGFITLNSRTIPGVGLQVLVPQMDRWLANIAADRESANLSTKIVRNKPKELADGCIAVDGERIFDPATLDGPGRCNQMYPAHGNPRRAAGQPVADDILKCELKPLDPSSYSRPLTAAQVQQLRAVFPTGVCDYSKPGVGRQAKPVVWLNLSR